MKRIELVASDGLKGEPTRLFEQRTVEGFWDRFVRPGPVVDIGYRGHLDSTPIFQDAVGLDIGSPGYDGRHLPFSDDTVGTIHASHLLEHIADYTFFFRECFRALYAGGTMLIFVPLMDFYERRKVPPSIFNADHRRFYTASRLLQEIETSLPRQTYRVIHLRERFNLADFFLPSNKHATGPYEIECVIEKLTID